MPRVVGCAYCNEDTEDSYRGLRGWVLDRLNRLVCPECILDGRGHGIHPVLKPPPALVRR